MPMYAVHFCNEEIAAFEADNAEAACKNALQILKPEFRRTATYDLREMERIKQVTIECEGTTYRQPIFVTPAHPNVKPYIKWEIFTGAVFHAWLAGDKAGEDRSNHLETCVEPCDCDQVAWDNPYPGE